MLILKALKADSSSPLYHQLMQRITADIEQGTYPTGSRIPPEHELEQLYQVSRVTVRRALAELTSEGLLERKQGKGTFVSMPKESDTFPRGVQSSTLCLIAKEKVDPTP